MADPKVKIKRSSVEGRIPTPDQVPLGELALNTYDGYLYASKNVGIGTTVIAINPFRVGTGTDSYNAYFTAGSVGIGTTNPTSKLTVSGNSNITGDLYVSGITTLAGNINLGDNTSDDITVSGEFVSNLIPNATNSYDLGSSTQKWKDVWSAGTVNANSFSGSGTNLTGIVTSIVAGNNITISGSTGQVTINSTASGGGGGTSTPLDILEVMLFA